MVSILAALVLAAVAAHAQTPVGSITGAVGQVEIDAFGAGRFIRAEQGERLYRESVVRTGSDGRATLEIEGVAHTVPPGTVVEIASLLRPERRSAPAFLQRLVQGIADALTVRPQRTIAGTTASSVDGGTPVWAADELELFRAAEAAVASGDFAEAVELLLEIYPGTNWQGLGFTAHDYYRTLAHSLLGVGDAEGALEAAFEYAGSDPDPAALAHLTPQLQFLAALAADAVGDAGLSSIASDRFFARIRREDERQADRDEAREALAFAIRVLVSLGHAEEAASLEELARSVMPDLRTDAAPWDDLLGRR